MSILLRILFFPFAVLLLTVTTASAQGEIRVDKSCSLADAIAAANTDRERGGCPAGNGADVIHLAESVTLQAELPSISSEITLHGYGNTISGSGQFRLFNIEIDGALTINYATLEDGWSADDSQLNLIGDGGAILNLGVLKANHSVFRNNQAGEDGGAIRNVGEAHISGSTFLGNSADRQAGAIYSADASTAGSAPATLTIDSSAFLENRSARHAGAAFISGEATIYNSSFNNNSAEDSGGAIYSVGQVHIRRTQFSANTSQKNGGAIFNDLNACIFIHESDFSENIAGSGGGGLFSYGGARAALSESRLSRNIAEEGGGYKVQGFKQDGVIYDSEFYLHNTWVWENRGGDCFYGAPTDVLLSGLNALVKHECGAVPPARNVQNSVSFFPRDSSKNEDHWYIERLKCPSLR